MRVVVLYLFLYNSLTLGGLLRLGNCEALFLLLYSTVHLASGSNKYLIVCYNKTFTMKHEDQHQNTFICILENTNYVKVQYFNI